LVAIAGDMLEKELAMSAADREVLINNVNVIYHCAATVRFDEPLRRAIMMNTRGTKLVLDLAEQCKVNTIFFYSTKLKKKC
jgi:alcohol-forming fatty acyl-CoA reductase